MPNLIKTLGDLLWPMPSLRSDMIERVTCSSTQAADFAHDERVVDLRRKSEAHGLFYYLGAVLVWKTPLRLVAQRVRTIRGDLRQNPFHFWCVTRRVAPTHTPTSYRSR